MRRLDGIADSMHMKLGKLWGGHTRTETNLGGGGISKPALSR